jgi:hypothetical protein
MTLHPFLQFPQLFFLAPLFVPVILRIGAALTYLYIAWHTHTHRDEVAATRLPVIGKAGWAVPFAVVVEVLIGASLLFGYYAQLGALVGGLGALKFLILKRQIGAYDPISRTAAFLLFVICLSLIVAGAGAFAFDQQL